MSACVAEIFLWSIAEQTHGHTESICFIQQRREKVNSDVIYAPVLESTNQSEHII